MFEGNLKNVCQKAVKTNLSSFCSESNVQCFVIMLWKWMKFENRLTFIYYSVTFWNFKSLQSVSKTWQMLKTKKIFLQKSSKYWSTVYPDFSLFFPIITSTVYCSKYCFSTIFFPKSWNMTYLSADKNTRVVLESYHSWKGIPAIISGGVDIHEASGFHLLQKICFQGR